MSTDPARPSNLTLIGMPASGKSTLGRLLAARLSMRYIDMDHAIESAHGQALNVLLTQHGSEGFLDLEAQAVLDLPEDLSQTVLAPGGSIIYRDSAMQRLRAISTVVYLQVSLAEIERRIGCPEARGVVLGPGQSLADLYAQRVPLYEQYAHVSVGCQGQDEDQTAAAVATAVAGLGLENA